MSKLSKKIKKGGYMKKILVFLMVLTVSLGMSITSYASDWDKAGKALTIIEGLRVFTGGNVDVIGSLTGINKNKQYASYHSNNRYHSNSYKHQEKVWVPHFVWKKKYIPEHKEYSKEHGEIIVEGHYIKYKVETGGHWECY